MPHKRAKRSIREANAAALGKDNPPNAACNKKTIAPNINKAAFRVLNAEATRNEMKRKRSEQAAETDKANDNPNAKKRKIAQQNLKLNDGETLGHFNRRVDQSLHGDIRSSIKGASAKATKKEKKKQAVIDKPRSPTPEIAPKPVQEKKTPIEFATAPRLKLHDIVMEPPTLTKKPKGASSSKKALPIGLKQAKELEMERAKAIERYRQLKAGREK